MALIISTAQREELVIDDVKYTVRPLTGAEKIEMEYTATRPRFLFAARKCVVGITGPVLIDGKDPTPNQIDLMPSEHIVAVAALVAKISGLEENAAKNSLSRPQQLPGGTATTQGKETSSGVIQSGPPEKV